MSSTRLATAVGLLIVLAIIVGLYMQQAPRPAPSRSRTEQLAATQRQARENPQLEQQESSLHNLTTILDEACALGMVLPDETACPRATGPSPALAPKRAEPTGTLNAGQVVNISAR